MIRPGGELWGLKSQWRVASSVGQCGRVIRASGVRIGWADLPSPVRAALEEMLGGRVISAMSQIGGFSPGTADRVITDSGARAFVKAVSSDLNPVSPRLHRKEIAATRELPPGPVPRFLGSYDDGTWVALVLEDVEGRHPVTPWQAGELDQVLAMLARITATPPPACLPTAEDEFAGVFSGWQRLLDDPDPDVMDDLPRGVGELRDSAADTLRLISGDSLVHQDIRADNLLLTVDGPVLVDWPNACRGAAWLDSVLLLINVRLYGGLDTTGLLHAAAARFNVPLALLVDVLTACAGYFVDAMRQPPPPGLPTVRAFQRAQAETLLAWLAELSRPTI